MQISSRISLSPVLIQMVLHVPVNDRFCVNVRPEPLVTVHLLMLRAEHR